MHLEYIQRKHRQTQVILATVESPYNIYHLAILSSFSSQPRHPHNKSTECLPHYALVYSYPLDKIYVKTHIERAT